MKTKLGIIFLIFAAFILLNQYMPGKLMRLKEKKKCTHITKVEPFQSFCQRAATDSEVFSKFKKDAIFTLFYENATYEEGLFFYKKLKNEYVQFLTPEVMDRVKSLDTVGDPYRFYYDGIGFCSPSTLRYLFLATQLPVKKEEALRIIEIGGGGGGRCKVLHDLYDIEHYTIIDLPETLALTERHLKSLGITDVELLTPEEVTERDCDLLFSDYGFSESNGFLQKRYLTQLVKKAKKGFMVCNFVPRHFRVRPLPKKRLLKSFEGLDYRILPEEPRTGKENFILVWGQDV